MKILILGSDGYIGYPLSIHLLKRGHKVICLDNFSRRKRVEALKSQSLTPIKDIRERRKYLKRMEGYLGDVYHTLCEESSVGFTGMLAHFEPEAIVHLAEQPSAPWSMANSYQAVITQRENVLGTLNLLWAMRQVCPEAHLVKLGTMGEYGTPNCYIPEGKVPKECLWDIYWNDGRVGRDLPEGIYCPMSGLLFPRTPGSFYHLTKVHDTFNIEFACRNWGLRSTDIMQGVLFGLVGENENELTRFDYDEYFGTAINRFCAQALIDHPLTVYGKGNQTRGFLPLKDSLQCLTIALESPPALGEYRTLNQFENIYRINDLAEMVVKGVKEIALENPSVIFPDIIHIENPRYEAEEHYYNPDHRKLFEMGYVPTTDIQGEITELIKQLLPYKDRIKPEVIMPETKWR